jgi:hypothetical protein
MGVFFALIENVLITDTTLFAQISQKYDFIRTCKKRVAPYCRKGYSRFECEIIS